MAHSLIMVNMSAKFDKETSNGVASMVLTRFTHGQNNGRMEPQQRYYIPTATRCAGIKRTERIRSYIQGEKSGKLVSTIASYMRDVKKIKRQYWFLHKYATYLLYN